MKRTFQFFAVALVLVIFGAEARAAVVNPVVLDLSGKTFGNKLDFTAQNTTDSLAAGGRYDYSVSATVTATGALGQIIPNNTSLQFLLEVIKPGSSAYLNGTALNPSGKLPFKALNKTVSGKLTPPGSSVSYAVSLVLTAGIDAAGHASFGVTKVSIKTPEDAGTIVFAANSTATIGNPLLGTDGVWAGAITDANPSPDAATSGIASITVAKTGTFTGSVTLAGVKHAFKGTFDSQGATAPIVVIKPAVATLHLTLNPQTSAITGTVTGTPAVSFTAYKATWSKAHPLSHPGLYTFYILLPSNNNLIPQGVGYGTAKVAVDGTAKFTLTLPDNTKTSASVLFTNGASVGDFQLYIPLYKSKGVFLSALHYSDAGSQFTGGLGNNGTANDTNAWIKPASLRDKLYPGGFATYPRLVSGLSFVKPPAGTPVLPASVHFYVSGGNLGANAVVQSLNVSTASKVTPNGANPNNVKVTLSTTTGLLSGSFQFGAPAKTYKFAGIIQPGASLGEGLFIGQPPAGTAAETGFVQIQP